MYSLDSEDFTNDISNNAWQWKQLKWSPRRGWGQIRLSLEMFKRPPNVLFVPGSMIPFVHPRDEKKKQFTVTTVHDVGFLERPDLYDSRDARRQNISLSFAIHNADRIFVPSQATDEAIKNIVHHENQVIVSPLGVNHEKYKPSKNLKSTLEFVGEKYGLAEPYLLYVGRVDAKKNLAMFLTSFAQWANKQPELEEGQPPLKIAIVGSRGFGAGKLDDLVREMNLSDTVIFLGFVDENDLPQIYQGTHAFIFPSAYEGFGLPVLQALSSGIPTLASDIPALRELAEDAAIYADPANQDAWVSGLERIINDENLRMSLRERGLIRASEFSWQKTSELTWQGIQNLI